MNQISCLESLARSLLYSTVRKQNGMTMWLLWEQVIQQRALKDKQMDLQCFPFSLLCLAWTNLMATDLYQNDKHPLEGEGNEECESQNCSGWKGPLYILDKYMFQYSGQTYEDEKEALFLFCCICLSIKSLNLIW